MTRLDSKSGGPAGDEAEVPVATRLRGFFRETLLALGAYADDRETLTATWHAVHHRVVEILRQGADRGEIPGGDLARFADPLVACLYGLLIGHFQQALATVEDPEFIERLLAGARPVGRF